jgi:hypothetical protein
VKSRSTNLDVGEGAWEHIHILVCMQRCIDIEEDGGTPSKLVGAAVDVDWGRIVGYPLIWPRWWDAGSLRRGAADGGGASMVSQFMSQCDSSGQGRRWNGSRYRNNWGGGTVQGGEPVEWDGCGVGLGMAKRQHE